MLEKFCFALFRVEGKNFGNELFKNDNDTIVTIFSRSSFPQLTQIQINDW